MSNFSNFIYFTDAEGSVFCSEAEVLRRVSSRKKKNPKNCGSLLIPLMKSKFDNENSIFQCSFANNSKKNKEEFEENSKNNLKKNTNSSFVKIFI